MEAFATFDVSVVEVDNLCGMQYTLVIVCTRSTLNPLTKYKRCFFFLFYTKNEWPVSLMM